MGQRHEIVTSSFFHTFLRFPFIFEDSVLVILNFLKAYGDIPDLHTVSPTQATNWSHSPTTVKPAKKIYFLRGLIVFQSVYRN